MKKFEPEQTKTFDILRENIERLKTLFPEAVSEGKIDIEILKQLLGGAVDEREEKYGLNWHGKRCARQIALTPSTGTLRPCPEDSVDWDTTQNLMIEGDNLEVLKLLQKILCWQGQAHLHRPALQHRQGLRLPRRLSGQYQEVPGADGTGRRRQEDQFQH